jgi:hypothetical protein
MTKKNQVFIDGAGEIRIHDGLIRIDLLAMSPTLREENGQPTPAFVQQLVMSPAAFMRLVGSLGTTLKNLEKRGLLKLGEGGIDRPSAIGETSAPVRTATKKKKPAGVGGSPNF